MREKREKENSHVQTKGKEDKELLVTSCKEVQKVKHVHKPLYLLFPSNVCSMSFDKGVQVDQDKIKRKSMNFSIPKHLDLSSFVIAFFFNVTRCRGKNSKRGNQSISWTS